MAQRERRSREWRGPEVIGVVLIVAGAYWLLAQSQIFFWLGWGLVWPLILVGLGVLLIASRRGYGGGVRTVNVPREGVEQLELNVAMGGGHLLVEGGAAGLVEATSAGADMRSDVRRSGTAALVRLRREAIAPGSWWGATEWRVRATSDVGMDLRVTAGAGEFTLDLASIRLLRATLSIGAAHTTLSLPRPAGTVDVKVSTGAASVVLQVPPGVEYRVATVGGLISVDGVTESPGYAAAIDRLSIAITGGASSVTIR